MARVARIALDLTLATTQSLKPAIGIAWQYLKQEAAPPMTENFLNGPKAKEMEDSISEKIDDFIKVIEHRIKEADDIKQQQKEKKDLQHMDKTKNKDLNVKAEEKHVVQKETGVNMVNKIDTKDPQEHTVHKPKNKDVKEVNTTEKKDFKTKSVESSELHIKDKETKPRNG